jgi:recombination protein RecA
MAAIPLELLSKSVRFADALAERPRQSSRACDWPELDSILPDGGLPHAVVEITCAHHAFAGATRIAVSAIAAAQRRSSSAWCAWMDADATLFAPGLARAGVDLSRLLVVRPPLQLLPRVVVTCASSGAFDIVVVELHTLARAEKFIRKLALACEQHGTTIVLLAEPHVDAWPVALRLEVARTREGLDVRVTKDRFGRLPAKLAKTHVPLSIFGLASWTRSA